MKKEGMFALLIIIILIFINSVYAQIRINEIELNPTGSDAGNEWIELYSDSLINLDGWKLVSHDNKISYLNQSFNGYLVINFNEQWLDNENESIRLYNENNLIYATPVLKDSFNDNRTWSYCDEKWVFLSSSKSYANECKLPSNNTNTSINQTNPSSNNSQNNSSSLSILVEAEWDEDEIKNKEDFEIIIKALNLENKGYDVKAAIYDKDNKIISQTRDENNKWVSSSEYFNGFFNGPGETEENIELRIKDNYKNFKGDATLIIRIRENGSPSYKKEIKEDIEILESKNMQNIDTNDLNDELNPEKEVGKVVIKNSYSDKEEIIQLVNKKKPITEGIKTNKNIVYESKNELIKNYAIYFFAFLLIMLCVLLVFRKL